MGDGAEFKPQERTPDQERALEAELALARRVAEAALEAAGDKIEPQQD